MRVVVLALALAVGLTSVSGAVAKVITGTPRADQLVGTSRADAMRGLAGGDTLLGRGGADFIEGGPGRDVVDAGAGNDRVGVSYDGADRVRCGPGSDVVAADAQDSVASDCELVGRRISRDPYATADAQHETEVEPDSFTVGRTTVAVFQVGRREDGGATNIGYAVTTNDGTTWKSGLMPGLTVASRPPGGSLRASDPTVAYDAAHGTWLASTLALGDGTTRLAINRSSDGSSWSTAILAAEESGGGGDEGIAFDKNWIGCDNTPTSAFYGRCYLVYTHSADEDMLQVRTSVDGGQTWSPGIDIGARPAVGIFPAIRPTGELVVVYLWETSGSPAIASSRSVDGGASWATPVRIAEIVGRCAVRGFRAFALPSADVDASGRVWAAWHDCSAPGASTNSAFVASSADGVTWSAPAAATRGRNALLPAIGIDRASGRIALAYMRSSAAGIDMELVESRGGTTWGAPRRLSPETMPLARMPRTASGRMLGDYVSVHYARGRPLVVWVLASEPVGSTFRQAVYATRG